MALSIYIHIYISYIYIYIHKLYYIILYYIILYSILYMNENAGLPVDSPDLGVPSCLKLDETRV